MAGSLRQVPGKASTWELRAYLGRDPEGRVHHRSARFHGSRRQAERELARLVAEQGCQARVSVGGAETVGASDDGERRHRGLAG